MNKRDGNSQLTAQISVPAEINQIADIRQFIVEFLNRTPLHKSDMEDFTLAVIEAATNSIRHSKSSCVSVSARLTPNEIVINISDQGCGFTYSESLCDFPDIEAASGRGIPLMHNLADSLKVCSEPGKGTDIMLTKKIKKEQHNRAG